MNNKHKLLDLKTSALVDSLFIGNYKTKHKGIGIEFADYKEYDFSDDIKNIDFIKSEKEGKILVKLYEEERELSVYFVFNLKNSFFSSLSEVKKIDIFYELFYLIGLSAIKAGDKFGAFIFNSKEKKFCFAKKGKQNFVNIVNDIEKFCILKTNKKQNLINKIKKIFKKEKIEKKLNNGLKYFNSLKIKNSLVFYVTDELDIDTKQLKMLSSKNDLIVCNIFNHFENNLEGDGIIGLQNTQKDLFIDLNSNKKKKYVELRSKKIKIFKEKILKNKGKYIFLDETKNIYKEISILFQK